MDRLAFAQTEVIVDTSVSTSIIEFARANDIDVIAMASHSGAVSRLFLGSVADKVVRGATVPVLLYKPGNPRESASRNVADADIKTAGVGGET